VRGDLFLAQNPVLLYFAHTLCLSRSRIYERTTTSLRFLGIILRVFGIEFSVYNVYTVHYKPVQRYTSVRYFIAPILNSSLFRSYLCINGKVLYKTFFDWATIGGDRIVLRILIYAEQRFFCELGNKNFFFQFPSVFSVFDNNRFS
jgi:hypothetical protein